MYQKTLSGTKLKSGRMPFWSFIGRWHVENEMHRAGGQQNMRRYRQRDLGEFNWPQKKETMCFLLVVLPNKLVKLFTSTEYIQLVRLNSIITSMIGSFKDMLLGFHDHQRSQIEREVQVRSKKIAVLPGQLDEVNSGTNVMHVSYLWNVVAYQSNLLVFTNITFLLLVDNLCRVL